MNKSPSVSSDIKAWFPNLFIPGAGRSGTTTLHYCLNQHPDIFMAKDKEPNFFNNDNTFQLLNEYYQPLFKKGIGSRYRGEASVAYMTSTKAVDRISVYTHQPKFIFILRNPIDRAISHYNYWAGRGFEYRPFQDAFKYSLSLTPKDYRSTPTYYAGGCYAQWLKQYYRFFGKDSIHIITTEALRTQPQKTINSCFSFLSISFIPTIEVPFLNQSILLKNPGIYKNAMDILSEKNTSFLKRLYQRILSDRSRITIRRNAVQLIEYTKEKFLAYRKPKDLDVDTRRWVADYYHNDIQQLKKLTGHQFPDWLEFHSD